MLKRKLSKKAIMMYKKIPAELKYVFDGSKTGPKFDELANVLSDLAEIYSKKDFYITDNMKTIQILSFLEDLKIAKPTGRQKLYMLQTCEWEEFDYNVYANVYIFANSKALKAFLKSDKTEKSFKTPHEQYHYEPFSTIPVDPKYVENYTTSIKLKL